MRAFRAVVVAVVAIGVLGSGAQPAAALQPFPPGDDGIRAHLEMLGVACGETNVTTTGQRAHFENVPAEAEFFTRVIRDGVVDYEVGPSAPPVVGTQTVQYAGFSFPDMPYPAKVGYWYRVALGGKSTYIGGSLISCASAGATPVVTEVEIFLPPCGVGDAPVFPDVPASSSFCTDVNWATERGIVTGYGDGLFRPTAAVSRQAAVAFLYRAAGSPDGPDPSCASSDFSDVPAGHTFCGEIAWAVDEDITTGFPDATFRPTATVSRQAMAAFLYRAAGEPWGADPTCVDDLYSDVPAEHRFCGEIQWLKSRGITGGYPDGSFRPTHPVSRQGMAAFLRRAA